MYVPASDERKVRKTATMAVDTLVFDVEDGVAVNQKVTFGVWEVLIRTALEGDLIGCPDFKRVSQDVLLPR